MTTLRSPLWLSAGLAALLLAGCSGSAETTEETSEPETVDEVDAPEQAVVEESDTEAAGTATQIADRSLDVAVFHGGLEFQFREMTVTDLDAEASSDGNVDSRSRGLEFTFDVDAHNHLHDTYTPNMPVSLRWDEPGTGNVIDLSSTLDFRQVPSGASASGTITVTIPPAELDIYDEDSARLVLGSGHQANAQVPLGSGSELITRAPVNQPQLEGVTLEAGPVSIVLEGGELMWHQGGNQVAEDEPLLELYFTVTNDAEYQACFPRGEGRTLSLTDASGSAYVDLRVGERCVGSGATIDNVTGFTFDSDYAGDYTLRMMQVEIMADQFDGEVELTLVGDDNA